MSAMFQPTMPLTALVGDDPTSGSFWTDGMGIKAD